MIKYKRIKTTTLTVGAETLVIILSGASGKNRKITGITTDPLAAMIIRGYRDAEQIVDCQSIACTSGSPVLPTDIPLAEGQNFSIGFYNDAAATTAKDISVRYEETG
jgi:hypothetical protein